MIWIRNCEKIVSKLKTVITTILVILSLWCAIFYSKECKNGIINGMSFCVSVLIPSLFIFMVIASYISDSTFADFLSRILKKPTLVILNLPPVCSSVILLSIIGGYPVGARCVANLYKNKSISKDVANKLSMMAVCSGPGFVINYVGCALLNSKQAGVILFISQFISYVFVMLVCSRLIKTKCDYVDIDDTKHKKTGLVDAVCDGCKSTVNMCAMVILFSALISICETVFKDFPVLLDYVCALLEVTYACNKLSHIYSLTALSFIVGFGGICVHFQIFSALKDVGINKGLFFLFRILQGISSAVATYILLILFNPVTEVFSTVEQTTATSSTTILGSIALIVTAVCFLNSMHYTKIIRR